MQDLIEAGLANLSRDVTQQLRFWSSLKTGVDPDITVQKVQGPLSPKCKPIFIILIWQSTKALDIS